jgi:2-C-methyl-D-erythritol 2,4-cyclodiphosphate synthase
MDPTSTSAGRVSVQPELRIGHGYDLHRLEVLAPQGTGRPFVLGGVRLEHTHGPVAHSDGDALYHAVTDAILGALGLPDIGQLFPDTDPRYESEDSWVFIEEAARQAVERGYAVSNLDVTVILERPKLSPVKEQMRRNVASALRVEPERVNIKGKTHEKVDAVGEGRAVEVHAVVLLALR